MHMRNERCGTREAIELLALVEFRLFHRARETRGCVEAAQAHRGSVEAAYAVCISRGTAAQSRLRGGPPCATGRMSSSQMLKLLA